MRTPAAVKLRQKLRNLSKASDHQDRLNSLNEKELTELLHDWQIWARDDQLPPVRPNAHSISAWSVWLILGGRGAGKTRAGAEWVRAKALGKTPIAETPSYRIALVGETIGEVRSVMVEGISGLQGIHPDHERPHFEPSKRRLTWPNGTIAELYSAENPESLRGPQFTAAWCDELCKWARPIETWDMLQFALRLGAQPEQVITTTPRPISLLKTIMKDPLTIISHSKTSDNTANLSHLFLKRIQQRYAGTRLGRQELGGELIEDREDGLWSRAALERYRVQKADDLVRIVVAIDPPVTNTATSDQCGIIAAGRNEEGQGFILKDYSCKRVSPLEWARRAISLYHQLSADRIVAEVNQGGDLVEEILRQVEPNIPITKVRATKGKWLRAEPIAALYEQHRIFHAGTFPELEDEMCDFGPGGLSNGASPDRLDALVWALTDLMLKANGNPRLRRMN